MALIWREARELAGAGRAVGRPRTVGLGTSVWGLRPVLVTLLGLGLVLWQWPVGTVHQAVRTGTPLLPEEIYGDREVIQTFVATGDNLCEVGLRLAGFGRQNDVDLLFTLVDQGSATEVARARFPARELTESDYSVIAFPCLPHSKWREYALSITSPSAQPGRAATLWTNQEDLYLDGRLSFKGQEMPGDALFRLGYRSTVGDVVVMGLDSLTRRQPPWASDRTLYAALIALYLLTMTGAVVAAARTLAYGAGEDRQGGRRAS